MTRVTYRPVRWHYRRMPTATLGAGAGITPVQGTYYTVLDTVKNVRILSLTQKYYKDEALAQQTGNRVTLDGVVLTRDTTHTAHNTWDTVAFDQDLDTLLLVGGLGIPLFTRYIGLFAKSIKIEARTNVAVGTNPLLFASVQYEVLTEVT